MCGVELTYGMAVVMKYGLEFAMVLPDSAVEALRAVPARTEAASIRASSDKLKLLAGAARRARNDVKTAPGRESRVSSSTGFDASQQRTKCRLTQELGRRDPNARLLFHACQQLDGQHRVPARVEEIQLRRSVLDSKDVAP